MIQDFRIGDLDLAWVSDGILYSSVDVVLGMSREQVQRVSGAGDDGVLPIPVNNFLFRRDGATILIDAGAGNTMQPTLGKLPQNLRAAGCDPSTVTHILLTHLHPDHANGLVDDAHQPIFANAELFVHETEYEFWMRENDGSETPAIRSRRARNKINLAPYRERVRLVRDGDSVLGCTPVLAAGHSAGHTCWKIETGREALMAWGDIVHFSSIQMPFPETAVTYDLDADRARQSRLRMLELVANERLAVAGAHVDAPGIGYVTKAASGYAFQPAG